MNRRLATVIGCLFAAAGLIAFVLPGSKPAHAAPTQSSAMLVVNDLPTAIQQAHEDSFRVTCRPAGLDGGTIPTEIRAASGQLGFRCVNETAIPVYVGDNDQTAANHGPSHCTDSTACPDGAGFGGPFAQSYCVGKADAGQTVTDGGFGTVVHCRAIVGRQP